MTLALAQTLAVMPTLQKPRWRAHAESMLPHLNAAMEEAEINTPFRAAAFLAQIGHESLDLTRWVEMNHHTPVAGCRICGWLSERAAVTALPFRGHEAGEQYEKRRDLGNTEPGDGVRYKGRGCLQLTGRANYRAAGKALALPLEEQPERARDLDVGFRVAGWFWTSHGLNVLADHRKFAEITQRVNGGTNGAADRWARYSRALEVLGK